MVKQSELNFQGARLRLARIFNGLTLAELGEHVCATRQYVQKLETHSSVSPSNDMLHAIAEVLHFDISFFFEPLTGEVRDEECHFRKLRTTTLNLRNRALSYGTIFNFIVSYFESELELPKVDMPCFVVRKKEDVERAAEKCRLHWNLHLDAPIHNITRILERAGCIVTTFKGVSEKIDAFSYIRNRPIIVRSIGKGSNSRARFDLAHELGHLILHQSLETGSPELEDQANHFASAFLLPRVAFIREYPKTKHHNWPAILCLKKRWGVSMQAIIRRAYDLDQLTAVQYRNAYVHFSRTGQRSNEEGEENVINEKPGIIPKGFKILEESLGIKPIEVSRTLNINPCILENFGISIGSQEPRKLKNNVVLLDKYR